LLALLRNEGGSVGTSLAQTIQQRRDQFHSLRLGENLDPLNPAVNSYVDQTQRVFLQQSGDPVAANQMALQSLANLREQQSSSLAYFDVFFIFAVVAVALIVLVFFMKPSIAVKDAHLAAEYDHRNDLRKQSPESRSSSTSNNPWRRGPGPRACLTTVASAHPATHE